MPRGEGAEAFVAQVLEIDRLQDLIRPADGNAGRRAQHAQMTAHGTGGVARNVAQQHAHLACGVGDAVEGGL